MKAYSLFNLSDGNWSDIPHAHVNREPSTQVNTHVRQMQTSRAEQTGWRGVPHIEQQVVPRWAPAAGWRCAASLVSVGSCPRPRASLSPALSACTAAVYRCISSASPAGSNREQGTEGRGRLESTAVEGDVSSEGFSATPVLVLD